MLSRYKEVPLHQFFEKYISIAIPTFALGEWDYIPYDSDSMNTVLQSKIFIKDAHRTHFFFGKNEENEENKKKPYIPPAIDAHSSYSPELYCQAIVERNDSVSKELETSHPADIELTADELRALFVFSISAGHAGIVQGGLIRSGQIAMLTAWISRYNLTGIPDPAPINVERSPHGKLMVSHNVRMSLPDCPQIVDPISSHSAWHVEREGEAKEETYRLSRDENTLLIENVVWHEVIVPSATNKLKQIPCQENDERIDRGIRRRGNPMELTEARKLVDAETYYCIIPCLCDRLFRKHFIKKLAALAMPLLSTDKVREQSQTAYQLGMQGAEIYYAGQAEEWRQFQKDLKREIREKYWQVAAVICGIVLGIVGGALAATGIFSPAGMFLGAIGIDIASTALSAVASAALWSIVGIAATGATKVVSDAVNKSHQSLVQTESTSMPSIGIGTTATVSELLPPGPGIKDEPEDTRRPSFWTDKNSGVQQTTAMSSERQVEESADKGSNSSFGQVPT